jgi:hypothetical protein
MRNPAGRRKSGVARRALHALPLALLLACGASLADGQRASGAASAPASTDKARTATQDTSRPRFMPNRFSGRAAIYYTATWGIDSISVKLVESGELVRFSYRVVDPAKAGALHDKQNEATLDDPKAGVSLVVPTMEQVGQLRQTPSPVAGRSYWMTFSNKGRRVVRGDRIDVVIGPFRANNLVVD